MLSLTFSFFEGIFRTLDRELELRERASRPKAAEWGKYPEQTMTERKNKIDFKARSIIRDKECYYTTIKDQFRRKV